MRTDRVVGGVLLLVAVAAGVLWAMGTSSSSPEPIRLEPATTATARPKPPQARRPPVPPPGPANRGPWSPVSVPTVSSRYARVSHRVLQEYVQKHAAPGRGPETQRDPSMQNLRQLHLAVAAYRSALLFHRSPHVEALYERELVLLAMRQGGPIGPERLAEEACSLAAVPKDCPVDRFPTCGTYDRLMEVARALCDRPADVLPAYEDTDADFGRAELR